MNCKPGDIAIIVGTPAFPAFTPGIVGRVVEILRPHVAGATYQSVDGWVMSTNRIGSGPHWVVRSSTPLPWQVLGGPNVGKTWMFEERCILDSSLRPISGVPVDEEITDEVTA